MVTYDISDPKRWRRVFRIMEAFGFRLQLSVFQCRLTARRRAALGARLDEVIKHGEDHVLIVDVGPAEKVKPRVESIGKPYAAPSRSAIIV